MPGSFAALGSGALGFECAALEGRGPGVAESGLIVELVDVVGQQNRVSGGRILDQEADDAPGAWLVKMLPPHGRQSEWAHSSVAVLHLRCRFRTAMMCVLLPPPIALLLELCMSGTTPLVVSQLTTATCDGRPASYQGHAHQASVLVGLVVAHSAGFGL